MHYTHLTSGISFVYYFLRDVDKVKVNLRQGPQPQPQQLFAIWHLIFPSRFAVFDSISTFFLVFSFTFILFYFVYFAANAAGVAVACCLLLLGSYPSWPKSLCARLTSAAYRFARALTWLRLGCRRQLKLQSADSDRERDTPEWETDGKWWGKGRGRGNPKENDKNQIQPEILDP